MKPDGADKLLGGYATGTLTEEERRALFEAALTRQDLFDALADEEALRELLADPAAKAQLMAALAPRKAVPLWRRPTFIGAAAGLIVAATAGLAYLRSPEAVPRPQRMKALEAPGEPAAAPLQEAPAGKLRKGGPPEQRLAPVPESLPPHLAQPEGPLEAPALRHEAVAGAAAPAPAPTPVEVRPPSPDARGAEGLVDAAKKAEAAPVSAAAEVFSRAPARTKEMPAPSQAPRGKAVAEAPAWSLEPQAGGRTLVRIAASREARVVLLHRHDGRAAALSPQSREDLPDGRIQWRYLVPLAGGEALDLYLPEGPVADPAALPETGPFQGFRVRIHPAAQ